MKHDPAMYTGRQTEMVYGVGTRSFHRSPEHRQMKRERAEFTRKFKAGEIKFPKIDPRELLSCTCRSFRYPHGLDSHKKLRSEHDWRPFEEREPEEERRESSHYQEWRTIR